MATTTSVFALPAIEKDEPVNLSSNGFVGSSLREAASTAAACVNFFPVKRMTDSEITLAIETNLFELYRLVAMSSGRPLYIGPFVSWINCAPSRWPNTIFAPNFGAEDADERIRFVKDHIRDGSAPNNWSTGPSTRPADLETRLEKEGFERMWTTAGMGMELSELKSDFETPRGLKVEIVSDGRALRDWARVVALGLFGCAESEVDHFYGLMKTVAGCDRLELYLARQDGEPAGSATTYFSSDGIVGIYHVATLPEFRRRGIGRSITLAPLLTPRALGARAAILQATAAGESVYRRLGFRTICTLGRHRLAS
jgi:GNAT superfamily N-acetyltransferase